MLGRKALKHMLRGTIATFLVIVLIDLASTVYVLKVNTDRCLNDTNKVRVVSIDKDETILLEDSSYLKGSSISTYIRVNPGTGTYYAPSSNALIVEIDWLETYRGYIVVGAVLLVLLVGIIVF